MAAIDLGSRKAVIAQYRGSFNKSQSAGVDIIHNQIGRKTTDICIAYPKDKERVIGLAATSQARRNLDHTFMYLTRLIGLRKQVDDSQI